MLGPIEPSGPIQRNAFNLLLVSWNVLIGHSWDQSCPSSPHRVPHSGSICLIWHLPATLLTGTTISCHPGVHPALFSLRRILTSCCVPTPSAGSGGLSVCSGSETCWTRHPCSQTLTCLTSFMQASCHIYPLETSTLLTFPPGIIT